MSIKYVKENWVNSSFVPANFLRFYAEITNVKFFNSFLIKFPKEKTLKFQASVNILLVNFQNRKLNGPPQVYNQKRILNPSLIYLKLNYSSEY